ncbi:MAG TPA: hypothetical protein VN496_03600 [Burkholderiales bacterium]|nr:hypothetical protein [Burkholderiales bacterium]
MKSTGWLIWTLCAALGACASQPKEPPRIMMQGFSISAPKEKEKTWVVAQQSPELTVIGKQGRFTGESFSMQTTIIKLPAFTSSDAMMRYVESSLRKEIDPKRFRLFKLETSEQKVHQQTCALSRLEMAERTSSDGTASPVNTMLETMTLTCPHPQDPLRAINMAYSHRHFPEDLDPQFAQEGAMLMQTLEFEPL